MDFEAPDNLTNAIMLLTRATDILKIFEGGCFADYSFRDLARMWAVLANYDRDMLNYLQVTRGSRVQLPGNTRDDINRVSAKIRARKVTYLMRIASI